MALGWDKDVLCVFVQRRDGITPDIPLWARFKITRCRRFAVDLYAKVQVEENPDTVLEMNALMKTREELTREARQRGPGYGGVIMMFQWDTPAGRSIAPYVIRMSPSVIADAFPVDDPFKHLETIVEKFSTSWRDGKADHTVVSSMTCN